jgi:hypothetical protein
MIVLRVCRNHAPERPIALWRPAQNHEPRRAIVRSSDQEAQMTHLFFHCTGPGEVLVDCQGVDVLDLDEARDHALSVARSIVEDNFGRGDFSEWIVFVFDEDEDEMLTIPFRAVLPTLH